MKPRHRDLNALPQAYDDVPAFGHAFHRLVTPEDAFGFSKAPLFDGDPSGCHEAILDKIRRDREIGNERLFEGTVEAREKIPLAENPAHHAQRHVAHRGKCGRFNLHRDEAILQPFKEIHGLGVGQEDAAIVGYARSLSPVVPHPERPASGYGGPDTSGAEPNCDQSIPVSRNHVILSRGRPNSSASSEATTGPSTAIGAMTTTSVFGAFV
jgi:hypothetical protein